jgi:hypothetical protein
MSDNQPNQAYTFAKQFLIFLVVLNLGVLFALGTLYLNVDQQRRTLDERETAMIRDSIIYRDSLRRDTNFLKTLQVAPLSRVKPDTMP